LSHLPYRAGAYQRDKLSLSNRKKIDGNSYLSPLMNQIAETLGNDEILFNKVKNLLWQTQLDYEHRYLRNKITTLVSIDNFINEKIKEKKLDIKAVEIIKYCIYYLIKGAEQAYAERILDSETNWITLLAHKLKSVNFNEIIENLTVIIFNYDRIFEKYFIKYSEDIKSINSEQIIQFTNNVQHVYGSLGSLKDVEFKLPNDESDIIKKHYRKIELIDRSKKIEIIDPHQFKHVHFIGFGYDETNLQLINPKQFSSAILTGTAYKYSQRQIDELKTNYGVAAENNLTCFDYIKNQTF
jgi:hypothetical protein